MKIAHLLTRFSPDKHPGGVERVVDELATRQVDNHGIEIICRNQFNDKPKEQRNGYQVKRARVIDVNGLRTLTSFLSMRKLIKKSDADMFHIHDWSPYLNYMVAGSPKNAVLTLHNLSEGISGTLQQHCAQRASTCTCVSSWLDDRIKADTTTIPNGTALEQYKNRDTDGYLLFVGSLTERKGIEELCRVASTVDINLKIVGTGPLEAALHETYDHDFLGQISDKKLKDLYARCDAVALPSRKEGFGLVWIEALASGKPVLYTDTGIGAKLPNRCGVQIPANYTQEQLKTGLKKLENTSYNSESIQKYAQQHFGWKNVCRQYEKIYRGIQQS